MNAEKKQRCFDLLVKIGVKEIEVGFPSAGATEFDFISGLIRNGRVPQDVMVQMLTQSRRDLIERGFESLAGARAATVHLYTAISPAWREVVFGLDRAGVKALAITGADAQCPAVLRPVRARGHPTDDVAWRRDDALEEF